MIWTEYNDINNRKKGTPEKDCSQSLGHKLFVLGASERGQRMMLEYSVTNARIEMSHNG